MYPLPKCSICEETISLFEQAITVSSADMEMDSAGSTLDSRLNDGCQKHVHANCFYKLGKSLFEKLYPSAILLFPDQQILSAACRTYDQGNRGGREDRGSGVDFINNAFESFKKTQEQSENPGEFNGTDEFEYAQYAQSSEDTESGEEISYSSNPSVDKIRNTFVGTLASMGVRISPAEAETFISERLEHGDDVGKLVQKYFQEKKSKQSSPA